MDYVQVVSIVDEWHIHYRYSTFPRLLLSHSLHLVGNLFITYFYFSFSILKPWKNEWCPCESKSHFI